MGSIRPGKPQDPFALDEQTPIIEYARERRAQRSQPSHWEAWWPAYFGFGVSGLIYFGLLVFMLGVGGVQPIGGLVTLFMTLPMFVLSFLIISFIMTRFALSLRGGAETIGNLMFLSGSTPGFKIGALIGLGLFLWSTPEVFGDPFTGNPSAPSAIVAQLILKALVFMGICGALISRLERFVRKRFMAKAEADFTRGDVPVTSQEETDSRPMPPAWMLRLLKRWPIYTAGAGAVGGFICACVMFMLQNDPAGMPQYAIAAVYAFASLFVLWGYFFLLDKLLRAMFRLYKLAGDIA